MLDYFTSHRDTEYAEIIGEDVRDAQMPTGRRDDCRIFLDMINKMDMMAMARRDER